MIIIRNENNVHVEMVAIIILLKFPIFNANHNKWTEEKNE